MPHLRLTYQLSRNPATSDGTKAIVLRIYAGPPPAFLPVCRCNPADFVPARNGRAAEVRGNRPLTNIMRVRMAQAEATYLAMIQAGEPITSQAYARLLPENLNRGWGKNKEK